MQPVIYLIHLTPYSCIPVSDWRVEENTTCASDPFRIFLKNMKNSYNMSECPHSNLLKKVRTDSSPLTLPSTVDSYNQQAANLYREIVWAALLSFIASHKCLSTIYQQKNIFTQENDNVYKNEKVERYTCKHICISAFQCSLYSEVFVCFFFFFTD